MERISEFRTTTTLFENLQNLFSPMYTEIIIEQFNFIREFLILPHHHFLDKKGNVTIKLPNEDLTFVLFSGRDPL